MTIILASNKSRPMDLHLAHDPRLLIDTCGVFAPSESPSELFYQSLVFPNFRLQREDGEKLRSPSWARDREIRVGRIRGPGDYAGGE